MTPLQILAECARRELEAGTLTRLKWAFYVRLMVAVQKDADPA